MELLLPFDTDHPQFARGFEAGRVWALLRESPDQQLVEMVHAKNAEMLMRMAEATDREVRSQEVDEDWIEITFSAADCALEPEVTS